MTTLELASGIKPAHAQGPGIDLSVVVPMYNEQEDVRRHIERLIGAIEGLGRSWELIAVNDGSTDQTMARLQECQKLYPRLQVVSYKKNRGRGYALRKGFEIARGERIVSTEADLSCGTAIIGQMLQVLDDEGVEIAIASPHAPGGGMEGVPVDRVFWSRYGNRILRCALGGRTFMASGMTRAYHRQVLEMLDLESEGKEIHLEVLSKAYALGFRSCDVPVTLRWDPSRRRSRAKRQTFKLVQFVLSHLLFSFSEFPFLLTGTIALVLFSLGLGAGAYAFWLSSHGIPVGSRPLTIGAVMCILAGIQLMMFSFMSHQLRDVKQQMIRLQSRLLTLNRRFMNAE